MRPTRVLPRGGFWPASLVCACALILSACATRTPAPVQWHTTELGLCEDYPEESRSLASAEKDLATARASGARVLRIAFGWDAMEPERGRYDWTFWDVFVREATENTGIRLIPYVCYTPKWAASDQGDNYWRSPPRDPEDYARFVSALVRHYRGRIHSWELWNEPDNQAYWLGTTPQFAALVRAGSSAVRNADPTAAVVLGGIAGELDFLAKLLRDEHVGEYVDVINIHSYYETWHPSPIERLPAYIGAAAGLIHDSGGRQQLWMAETGYSTVGDRPEVSSVYRAHFRGEHTDQAQAAALARTLVEALATTQLTVIAWYRINDLAAGQDVIGDDNNRHLGLRDIHGAAKPALRTFAYLARLFNQPYAVLPASVAAEGNAREAVQVRAFRLRDNRRLVVAWLAMPEEPAGRTPLPDDRDVTIRITVPATSAHAVELRDAAGRSVNAADATWRSVGGQTELTWHLRDGGVYLAELLP